MPILSRWWGSTSFLLMPDKNTFRCLALFPLTPALSRKGRGRNNIETLPSAPFAGEGWGEGTS